jgi:hypothetical protein
MSEAIGPGDWVECICNRLPTTLPPIGLVVGRTYQVDAAGVTPDDDSQPGVPWVRLVGVLDRGDRWGFRASWFRPIAAPMLAVQQREFETA